MTKTISKKIAKGSVFLSLAFLMMGNEKCQEPEIASRELRRRVEMGMIEAPPISLPEGGRFDFKFVANAQLYDVLRKTQSFSTSTMDGTHDLTQMTQADRDAFNRCDDDVLNAPSKLLRAKADKVSTVATCMINMPQAVIEGSVTGFELVNSVGLAIDLLKPADIGFSIDVKKATLTMAFQADDPLIPGQHLATSTPRANRQELALSANVNLGAFSVGPHAYFKSPLADVVNKAMVAGIKDLKEQMDANSPWYAMVLKNCDKAILINAGGASDAGLQKGDILEVYNVRYRWEDEVCESNLLGSLPSSGDPIAVAQVEVVGDTLSQARIIQQTEVKIQPGARVYVRKLIQPSPKAPASRSSR